MLPELSSQEYSDEAFACLDELDDDLAGPVFATFADLAGELGTTIAFGMARRLERRSVNSTAARTCT
ncbi:hypothetical protein [Halomonas sp.]|uniref:hypothetical protein n=1 Tax=Halomonas sp. TaxID=1486246 RepID=UPI0035667BAC